MPCAAILYRMRLSFRYQAFSRLLAAVLLLYAPATQAEDALIDGAKTCTQYFPTQEQRHQVPLHLLAAIASAESGRWHQGLNMPLPWPWTINANGKGYYFESKAKAIAKTRELQARGIKSIDVGCMQVNLKHHATAFRDLEEAFNPQYNVAYAAQFLRQNYEDLGDWVKATAAYHSRTPHLGGRYLQRIKVTWNRIVSRVREAYLRRGGDGYQTPHNPLSSVPDSVEYASAPPAARTSFIASSRNVRVLSVSDAGAAPVSSAIAVASAKTGPRDSMLVVAPSKRGAGDAGPVQVAYAAPLHDASFVTQERNETTQSRGENALFGAQNIASRAKKTARSEPKKLNFIFAH